MPTARELNQKVADVSIGWSSFLGDVHRMLNDVEASITAADGMVSTLAVPSPYRTPEQRISDAVTRLSQLGMEGREKIRRLRTFLTV